MSLFDMCCPRKPKKSLDYVIKWVEDTDKDIKELDASIKELKDWKDTVDENISELVTEAIEDYDWSKLPEEALQAKADKVENATEGHFASLDSNGNLQDSNYNYSSFAPSVHSHSEIKAPGAFANYAYARIESGVSAPVFKLKVGGVNDISAQVEVNVDNIDNLNRALEKPDTTPIYNSDKLITSSAVAEGLNRKANSVHVQGIETIVGLNAVIASLTERIRALEEQPITESIQLTGSYQGYNTLLNGDLEILYSAQSTERKLLYNIDTLYNFAEIGSAVTLSYTVPNTPSNTTYTFNTVVVTKLNGPNRLVLRDSIPDVPYVNYTDITLTITK